MIYTQELFFVAIRAAALLLCVVAYCPAGTLPCANKGPDLILHNGKIVTVDAEFSVKQALAVSGDKILCVGDNSSILELATPSTRVIDLKGKTVIPGLIDDHYHMLSKAVDEYLGVDVTLVSSIAEMLHAIRAKVKVVPAGKTVYTTSGWLPEQLKEHRPPSRYELDSVSPVNPVVVQGGHTMYLNSIALRMAGINRGTPSSAGGLVEKDPITGEPTGLLVDNAMSLADKLIPQPSTQQKLEAIKLAQRQENAVGITSIREPGISPSDMRAYQELWRSNALTVRVSMGLDLNADLPTSMLIKQLRGWGVTTGFGDSMLRLDGIGEFGIDGGFEAALMTEPYESSSRVRSKFPYFGLQLIPTQKFREVMLAINTLGWRGCIHSVGDKATDLVLDAYEETSRAKSIGSSRWVLEHGLYMRPDQMVRARKLGLVISAQFHPYMAAPTIIANWGRERAERAAPMREWLDTGLPVGGGSDWSVVPANPFWMIYFFVARETRLWGVLGAGEKISRQEALRVMTINNAYLTFEEHRKGSIEAGKLADIVVISDDILSIPENKILEIHPLLTVLGGAAVYQSKDWHISINKSPH